VATGLDREVAATRSASGPTLDQLQEYYLVSAERDLSAETYTRRVELLDRVLDWPEPGHRAGWGRSRPPS
jgi:hypothetical protein